MKKKLAAVLLTLCMVSGMLPMCAFAAWYKDTVKTDVPDDAKKGDVITVDGNQYYVYDIVEQDTLTVRDANGKEVTLTKVSDTTYTFLMPETAVTVEAAFKAAASRFSDVADPASTARIPAP